MSILMLAAESAAQAAAVADVTAQSFDWLGWTRFVLTVLSLATGLFFVLAGTIGVIRLPDFYTRLHAAGMTDTLGAELILIGLIIQSGISQLSLKLALVAFFLLVTSPTATHAVAHAAYRAGLKPVLGSYKSPPLEDKS